MLPNMPKLTRCFLPRFGLKQPERTGRYEFRRSVPASHLWRFCRYWTSVVRFFVEQVPPLIPACGQKDKPMLLGWIGQIVAVAALGAPEAKAAAPPTGLPDLIVTGRTTFAIPFSVPPATAVQSTPVEVILLVSRDLGANWQIHGQVPTEKGHFLFQADTDGEYWFRIQSRDAAGNRWPRWSGPPELRVRVDTIAPKIRVSAWRGDSGEVTARWRIDDANFQPKSVAVAYRSGDDTQWQDVAVGIQHQSKSETAYLGEVTWWPHQDARPLEVRVEAADKASNRSAATATVATAEVGAPPDRLTDASVPRGALPKEREPDVDYGQPWPAQPHPPLANQYVPEQIPKEDGQTPFLPPLREQLRPVNSRLFELEFDVDSADRSAITHVELWGTRDGGRTWQSISLHKGGGSPILAKAGEEGVYGFRIVVHSRTGSSRTPQPGDSPDIWIRVDLTRPVARIVSAEEGTGPEADHLVITWTAEDEELAAEPIHLAHSTRPGGPWTTIAKRLPNTGRYAWPLPAGDPGPIYLRLEVRDAAGNVGEFETSQPVTLSRAPPKVHIREVRPLGDSAHRPAPKRYIFR